MIWEIIIAGIALTIFEILVLRCIHRIAVGIFERRMNRQERRDFAKRDFRFYAVILVLVNVFFAMYTIATRR
jgi:hypothetical protein